MRKLKRRAISIILIAILIIAGLGVFSIRLYNDGADWAAFRGNGNVFSSGKPTRGSLLSREGELLLRFTKDGSEYSADADTRLSTVHVLGDKLGNISGGAASFYRDELVSYSLVNGVYSEEGESVRLSISSELSKAALSELNGRNGAIGVVNYKTGEILCMVSAPTFDPEGDGTDVTDGAFLNKFISSGFTPGSVFKLVTLTGAIEEIPDLYDRSFHCDGTCEVGGVKIACTHAHGDMKIEDALAASCNCTFAALAFELGADTMADYAKMLGITESFTIDGARVAAGKYDGEGELLPWSGVGQGRDLAVPAAMLRFVSAVANDGLCALFSYKYGGAGAERRLIPEDTAEKVALMMSYSVAKTYGRENFPGLSLAAKSGTAEVGGGKEPNAWFAGFSTDEAFPVAFVVMIENGGSGTYSAGRVANAVLQEAKKLF